MDRVEQLKNIQLEGFELFKKKIKIMVILFLNLVL